MLRDGGSGKGCQVERNSFWLPAVVSGKSLSLDLSSAKWDNACLPELVGAWEMTGLQEEGHYVNPFVGVERSLEIPVDCPVPPSPSAGDAEEETTLDAI